MNVKLKFMNRFLFFFCLLLFLSIFICCKEGKGDTNEQVPTGTIPPLGTGPLGTFPTTDPVEKDSIEEQIRRSIFYKIGCCSDKNQRIADCCCEKVVEKYRNEKKSWNNDFLYKIRTYDNIFSNCRDKRPDIGARIDAIDYPPEEESKKY